MFPMGYNKRVFKYVEQIIYLINEDVNNCDIHLKTKKNIKTW